MTSPSSFAPRGSIEEIETGKVFSPKFDSNGHILAIAAEAGSGEVLMVAYMNADALARTIETGEAWFWSRSRRELWRKGETSGNTLTVVEMRVDCDQDALLLKVNVAGNGVACHRGYRSCFYRAIPVGKTTVSRVTLEFDPEMAQATRVPKD